MIDINDIKNYKKCYKKSYEIYACRPPKGTLFYNKVLHPDLYMKLGKKDIFTAQDAVEYGLYNKYQEYIQTGQMQIADDRTILACGVLSELYCLDIYDLMGNFTFSDGTQMNAGALCEDWKKIKRKANDRTEYFACFVPKAQKGKNFNVAGTDHGKGDFIVFSNNDFNTRQTVNGRVFALTFNNTGFSDCIIAQEQTAITYPDIFPKKEEEVLLSMDAFEDKCDSVIKKMMQQYHFTAKRLIREQDSYSSDSYMTSKPVYTAEYTLPNNVFLQFIAEISNNKGIVFNVGQAFTQLEFLPIHGKMQTWGTEALYEYINERLSEETKELITEQIQEDYITKCKNTIYKAVDALNRPYTDIEDFMSGFIMGKYGEKNGFLTKEIAEQENDYTLNVIKAFLYAFRECLRNKDYRNGFAYIGVRAEYKGNDFKIMFLNNGRYISIKQTGEDVEVKAMIEEEQTYDVNGAMSDLYDTIRWEKEEALNPKSYSDDVYSSIAHMSIYDKFLAWLKGIIKYHLPDDALAYFCNNVKGYFKEYLTAKGYAIERDYENIEAFNDSIITDKGTFYIKFVQQPYEAVDYMMRAKLPDKLVDIKEEVLSYRKYTYYLYDRKYFENIWSRNI